MCVIIEDDDDNDLKYQLILKKKYLCRLCVTWKEKVEQIISKHQNWGPSAEDLKDAMVLEYGGRWEVTNNDSDDEESLDENSSGEEELVEAFEIMQFRDAYRDSDEWQNNMVVIEDEVVEGLSEMFPVASSRQGSPRKRQKQKL